MKIVIVFVVGVVLLCAVAAVCFQVGKLVGSLMTRLRGLTSRGE